MADSKKPTKKGAGYDPISGAVSKKGTKKSLKSAEENLKATQKAQKEARRNKQEDIMRKKTHQDLINVAYKAADKLGIAPWVLLRAAEWGHFTEDRGALYKGPMIDDIETLDDEQKKALKEVLELD
ncbi:MAG TPA: hypothetical protein G4N92_02275 [Anaerolineae bacterium]|nr:hypothetical protein [Anaerolineae bacterium]